MRAFKMLGGATMTVALGLCAVLWTPAVPGDLDEHELNGCDVDVGPGRPSRTTIVNWETSPSGKATAEFEIITSMSSTAFISPYNDTVDEEWDLSTGKLTTVTFTLNESKEDFTAVVKENGVEKRTWTEQHATGIYDELGLYENAELIPVKHRNEKKRAYRVTFSIRGLTTGFVIRDP